MVFSQKAWWKITTQVGSHWWVLFSNGPAVIAARIKKMAGFAGPIKDPHSLFFFISGISTKNQEFLKKTAWRSPNFWENPLFHGNVHEFLRKSSVFFWDDEQTTQDSRTPQTFVTFLHRNGCATNFVPSSPTDVNPPAGRRFVFSCRLFSKIVCYPLVLSKITLEHHH